MDKKHKTPRCGSMKAIVSTTSDRTILKALDPLIEGLAQHFGEHFEVVLHTMEDLSRSVIKIENGSVTGRAIGAPMTGYGVEILTRAKTSTDNVYESYSTTTNDGRLLRSLSVVIRNDEGKPIGVVCFNFDLSAPLADYLQASFMQTAPSTNPQSQPHSPETFPSTASDLVRESLARAIFETRSQLDLTSTKKNRWIVARLCTMGVFDIRGTALLVAHEMGVSVYTVYNYLREARFLRDQEARSHAHGE
jgi:predicted transcriptional regulator YheO